MLEIKYARGKLVAADQSTKDILKKGYFGKVVDGELVLTVVEALYLMDSRNATCVDAKGKKLSFNELSRPHSADGKFIARYFTYKDWRDRGLVIKDPGFAHAAPDKTPVKRYPSVRLRLPRCRLDGVFFRTDLTTVIEDAEKGKELYDNYWLGQFGTYKAADRGRLNKFDIYETLFLIEKGMLKPGNVSKKDILSLAASRRPDIAGLYEVYKDWRERGYVIKTGFKFGAHFRLYFPGAKPIQANSDGWVHSKHVVHVFPKESRLLISEWARAIRVAHSVKKTFILAVPGKTGGQKTLPDYILYHRKGGEADNPISSPPRYAMLSLGEEEYIGGKELSGAIKSAKSKRLDLILAIVDRETAVTYYKVRQIALPRSKHEYYEIDWMQP